MTNTKSKKEIWRVPMPTKELVMRDKNFNYNILAKTMLESNRNQNPTGLMKDDDMRYIYRNKFKETVEPCFLNGANKISKKTFDKHWRYIRKVDFDIIRAENTSNGIVYKLNYKDENNRKFVEVPSDILNELIICSNANVLKTYLVLLYALKDENGNNKNYTKISYAWLLSKIGLSEKSLDTMKVIIDFLENRMKLISVEIREEVIVITDKNGLTREQYTTPLYYKLVD
ncbi:hypothetical protein [Clostridium botulinum]|uniref:hypothetical protein n=1 Tax=Clostridium botulinum TaxID=1491 RepID=UPI0003827325|nr:hypothetical protein [Clostridium botulinum]